MALNRLPQRQDGILVPDRPATLVVTAPQDLGGVVPVLTVSDTLAGVAAQVDGLVLSWRLTAAQVNAALAGSTGPLEYEITAGAGDDLVPLFAGYLVRHERWDSDVVSGVALSASLSQTAAALVAQLGAEAAQVAAEAARQAAEGAQGLAEDARDAAVAAVAPAAIDAVMAAQVTNPTGLTGMALSSTYATVAQGAKADSAVQTAAMTAAIGTAQRASTTPRDRRANAASWNSATGALADLTSSGLTLTSGTIAASVGGTDGTAILPMWGPGTQRDMRASARITATKATGSSKSYIGFTVSAPSTMPTAGNFTFGVGYLAGTGLCIFRENIGAAVVILADASITDGTQYDVAIHVDTTLGGFRSATGGSIAYRIRSVSTGLDLYQSNTTFNITNFPVNNMMIRTNVAAGAMSLVKLAGHPTAPIGLPTGALTTYTTTTDDVFLHIPANPNGKLVIGCHGHGGTAQEHGWTSSTVKPTWDALVAAGFTIAVPAMGGNLWGNNAALDTLATLYNELINLYDLDPRIYLWGNSMGGGAALTAIAKGTFGAGNVRAAYLAEPACDLAALQATGNFPTIATAYPTTPERAANDPMLFPASAFAGVPMLFTASASDTSVSKTAHTDAMRTKLGTTVPNYLIAATGNHADASHFRANDCRDFFRANI